MGEGKGDSVFRQKETWHHSHIPHSLKPNRYDAMWQGWEQWGDWRELLYVDVLSQLLGLFTGKLSPSMVGGPSWGCMARSPQSYPGFMTVTRGSLLAERLRWKRRGHDCYRVTVTLLHSKCSCLGSTRILNRKITLSFL